MSEAWRTQWHKIPKYYPSAGRPLFPRGDRVSVRTFEDMLFRLKDRVFNSFQGLATAGIAAKVLLGHLPITQAKDLATYLYDNSIHPELLAKTLELVLKAPDRLLEARIRQLGRFNLAQAHKKNDIDLFSDIGRNFELFNARSEEEQLNILERMGVILLKAAPPIIAPPPRFSLDPQLKDRVRITQFPESFFAFERWSIAVTIRQELVDKALEELLKPESYALLDQSARYLKQLGARELRAKIRRLNKDIVIELKTEPLPGGLDSISITLFPANKQEVLYK
jgi:hypothetical protein